MTTSSVIPSGRPVNAVAGAGERHRDGAGKNPEADFSGLLSRLSVTSGQDGGASSSQGQYVVGRTPASPMRAAVPQSSPVVAPAHDPVDGARDMNGDGMARDVGGIRVAADGANFDTSGAMPLVGAEAEFMIPMNDVAAEDANTAAMNETSGQTEIQALLSSVAQSAPPEAGATVSQLPDRTASASTSGHALPASGVRSKAGGQSTGIAMQLGHEKATSDTQVSGEMELIEPTSLELENRGPSTASLPVKDQSLTSVVASDVKVVVLQTETHHAPVLFGSPVAQILDGIRAELTADGEIPLNGQSVDPAAAKLGSDAPIRTLLIQLQPADLGTVTVKMSLKDDALELHIEASQHETAQRLHQDQETLLKALRTAGYLVDGAAVRIVEADKMVTVPGNAGGQGLGTPSQSSYHGSPGGAPFGGGTSQGRDHHQHAARGSPDRTTGGADGDQRRSPSGRYV
jgi:chemotaxis protein MotD